MLFEFKIKTILKDYEPSFFCEVSSELIDLLFDSNSNTLSIGEVNTKFHDSKAFLHIRNNQNDYKDSESQDIAFSQTAHWEEHSQRLNEESQKKQSSYDDEKEFLKYSKELDEIFSKENESKSKLF
jgi:hypothetical protein